MYDEAVHPRLAFEPLCVANFTFEEALVWRNVIGGMARVEETGRGGERSCWR